MPAKASLRLGDRASNVKMACGITAFGLEIGWCTIIASVDYTTTAMERKSAAQRQLIHRHKNALLIRGLVSIL
jgi:hypothetical protein